jgi:hypothetical protein
MTEAVATRSLSDSRAGAGWRRLFAFERIEFARWELVIMRVLFALAILHYTPWMWPFNGDWHFSLSHGPPFKTQPEPVGLSASVDLTFLSVPAVFRIVQTVFYAGVLFYALGLAMPLAIAALLFANVGLVSLNAAQGAIGHSGQIIGLPLLLQGIASLVGLTPKWGGWRNLGFITLSAERLMVNWAQQAIVAAYLVSGCTKLIATHGGWILRGLQFALQMKKAQAEALSDSGAPVSELAEAAADFLAAHSWIASLTLAAALSLELLAPLALLNRRLSAIIGLALIGFHVGNDILMNLAFMENRWMLLVFFINIPFWIGVAWQHLIKRHL